MVAITHRICSAAKCLSLQSFPKVEVASSNLAGGTVSFVNVFVGRTRPVAYRDFPERPCKVEVHTGKLS